MKNTNDNNLDAGRATLETIRAKVSDARKVLADARAKKAALRFEHPPIELNIELAQAERNVLTLECEEADALNKLRSEVFKNEVASGDADAVAVASLFDTLVAAGERIAELKAETDRVFVEAREAWARAEAVHALLEERRAAAENPGLPRPHPEAIALVAFIANTKPADRSADAFRAALRSSIDVDALEGRTLEEKARSVVQGLGKSNTGALQRIRQLDFEIADMQGRAMEREREAEEARKRVEAHRLRREEEDRQLAERSACNWAASKNQGAA